MPKIYLYLSTAKLDQLLAQEPGFLAGVTAKIDFKLPFVSGGLSGAGTQNNISRLERLEKRLRREYSIPSHDAIPSGSVPVFVSFKGRAVRAVQGSEIWFAIDHSDTVLLLAGSASFALGERMASRDVFSPSGDPIGAFVRAFKETDKCSKDFSVADSVSYIWKALVADAFRSHADLPYVEGLAIYAMSLQPTSPQYLSWVRRPEVKSIVVGTPLFVRQIEEPATDSTLAQTSLITSRKRYLLQVSWVDGLGRAGKNKKRIDDLVLTLHRLGFRVAEGSCYSSEFYLLEYRRTGRWDRAFILYRPEKRELAEQIQSFVDEHSGIPSELLSIDEVISANGPHSANLMQDDADVTVLVCSD